MDFFEKLMKLDRRWVFLLLIVVCIVSYYINYKVPILPEKESRNIFDFIDRYLEYEQL